MVSTNFNKYVNYTGTATPYEPYSYFLYKVGTTFYAKNGITGNTDSSSTNASTVFQYAITNAVSPLIQLAPNTIFPITTGLTVPATKNLVLKGGGARSTFLSGTGLSSPYNMLKIGSDGSDGVFGLNISNIGFIGTAGTTTLLDIYNSWLPVVDRCYFKDFKYGIILNEDVGYGSDYHTSYAAQLSNLYINGSESNKSLATAGIWFKGYNASWQVTTCTVTNPYIMYCNVGLDWDDANGCMVTGGAVEHCGIGLHTDGNCGWCSAHRVDFEVNDTWDISIDADLGNGKQGHQSFIDCEFWSGPTWSGLVRNAGWDTNFRNCQNVADYPA